ncbi:general transcription factor II-I repeat domain-containing protein 2A-like [Metopolophium dirhodum]|uniref:general transcription factor II-I repeat domain-containing protein 2A-like n=1 Tax=Metopolophium dirhodum TaxID=44670 RepID=UPI00298F6F02|nr:general transcription factor II-I repeat domain-containing protein 2A-like [Metopolophium dirhodum]
MSKDITDQLQTDLASENYFSICLDESTDVTSQARLAVFVRFSSVNIMREELVKLMTISTKTTGQEIMNVVLKEFANLKININNIVSITTDGAPNMVGKHNGFVQLFSKEISHPLIRFHCLIHQEALCAKDSLPSLQNVMEVVTKVVNFITSRALNNRQFTKLLDEVESQYAGLLMYNSVRWLSRGQVLHRFVELLEEIRLFLFEKSQDYPELKDLNWLNDLMFFTNFTTMYNELNKKLQGHGHIVLTIFSQFRCLEPTFQFLINPHTITYDELDLSFFEWLNIENLEMELIEFQGNWKSLPNSFTSMKKLALSLLTMFGSTYTCEQLFSSMNFIKSTLRNRLGTDISAACIQLKSTNYNPRIDSLAGNMQQQISH